MNACRLRDLFPRSKAFPKLCPIAYHTILPYQTSFSQGAYFPWRPTKKDVVCQCPAPNGVVFLVQKTTKNSVSVKITHVGQCPFAHSIGQQFSLK